MYIYMYIYVCILYIYIYSEVMKTIQCAHPPHHHNDFVHGDKPDIDNQWRSSRKEQGSKGA